MTVIPFLRLCHCFACHFLLANCFEKVDGLSFFTAGVVSCFFRKWITVIIVVLEVDELTAIGVPISWICWRVERPAVVELWILIAKVRTVGALLACSQSNLLPVIKRPTGSELPQSASRCVASPLVLRQIFLELLVLHSRPAQWLAPCLNLNTSFWR